MMSVPVISWWLALPLRKQPRGGATRQAVEGAVSDASELASLAQGGTDALDTLYQRHGRAIFRFAYALTASREAAEEVTQEVFLFLLKEWRRFDASRGSLEAWLLGITRMMARKHGPSRLNVPLDGDEGSSGVHPSESSEVLDDLLRREQKRRLHEAIAKLPEGCREALVMHALQGLSYEQVAQQLGCPLGTVRSRIARAKEALARQLRPSPGLGEPGVVPLQLGPTEAVPSEERKGAGHVR